MKTTMCFEDLDAWPVKYAALGFTGERNGRVNRKFGKAEGRATESWPQRGAASGTTQVKEQQKVGP